MKQTLGSLSWVRKAAEIAPVSPPAAWQVQVNVLRYAEPFTGSFRAWIMIRASTITSENAIDNIVIKVQVAAKKTLSVVKTVSMSIDTICMTAQMIKYDLRLEPQIDTLSEMKPKKILQDQGIWIVASNVYRREGSSKKTRLKRSWTARLRRTLAPWLKYWKQA